MARRTKAEKQKFIKEILPKLLEIQKLLKRRPKMENEADKMDMEERLKYLGQDNEKATIVSISTGRKLAPPMPGITYKDAGIINKKETKNGKRSSI